MIPAKNDLIEIFNEVEDEKYHQLDCSKVPIPIKDKNLVCITNDNSLLYYSSKNKEVGLWNM